MQARFGLLGQELRDDQALFLRQEELRISWIDVTARLSSDVVVVEESRRGPNDFSIVIASRFSNARRSRRTEPRESLHASISAVAAFQQSRPMP
jgi:hypothetical protein